MSSTTPSQQQYNALFPKEWTAEEIPPPARDLSFYALRLVGQLYLLALAAFLIALVVGATKESGAVMAMLLGNPVMTASSVMFATLMAMMALTATYNPALRWHGGLVLLVGHTVAFVSFDVLYLLDRISPEEKELLLPSAIAVVVVLALFVMLLHRRYAGQYRDAKEFPEFYSLAHRLMNTVLKWTGNMSIILMVVVLAFQVVPTEAHMMNNAEYVSSLLPLFFGFISALCVLLFVMASSEALREYFFRPLVSAFAAGVLCGIVWVFVDGQLLSHVRWYLIAESAVFTVLWAVFIALRRMYYNIEYSVSAVSPATAQNVLALHDALYGGAPEDHAAILQSIDRHVAGIRGRKRGLLNFPFALLEYLVPLVAGMPTTFSAMSRDERRSLLRRSVLRPPDERARALFPSFAEQLYRLGTAAHALLTLAHFANMKGGQQIGYVPPDARDRLQGDAPKHQPPFKHIAPLPDTPEHPANYKQTKPATKRGLVAPRVVTPVREPDIPADVDYLIVGSGAGGAVCVLGTVKGDIHDIGKNIVGTLLEAFGFSIVDLGTDVDPGRFVGAVRDNGASLVGLSALLTSTMPQMGVIIEALREAGLRTDVRVAVGGAPVTPAYAAEIGADGYAEDGISALRLFQKLAAAMAATAAARATGEVRDAL